MAENRTWKWQELLVGIGLVMLTGTSLAQRASNWRVYKLADGLAEPGCIAITLSPQGKVLVRQLNFPILSQLDGYTVSTLGLPPGGNARVYQSPGGQLWTVVPEGLEEYTEGVWHFHGVPRIVGTYPNSARIIDAVPLMPVKQGLVLLMLPSGLMQFSASRTGSGQMTLLHSAGDS